jgi:hypothetical protein
MLEPGSGVEDTHGRSVGRAAELVTDERQQITHVRVYTGHVFRDPKLIPIQWVARIENGRVVLLVSHRIVERLPVANAAR